MLLRLGSPLNPTKRSSSFKNVARKSSSLAGWLFGLFGLSVKQDLFSHSTPTLTSTRGHVEWLENLVR